MFHFGITHDLLAYNYWGYTFSVLSECAFRKIYTDGDDSGETLLTLGFAVQRCFKIQIARRGSHIAGKHFAKNNSNNSSLCMYLLFSCYRSKSERLSGVLVEHPLVLEAAGSISGVVIPNTLKW